MRSWWTGSAARVASGRASRSRENRRRVGLKPDLQRPVMAVTSNFPQTHAPHDRLKLSKPAQAIELRIRLQRDELHCAFLAGLFEQADCLVGLTQSSVNLGQKIRRHIALARERTQSIHAF